MLQLEVRDSINLKQKQSIYLTLPFSQTLLKLVKRLPTRRYCNRYKAWEIPTKHFDILLEVFRDYDIEIVGDLPNKLEKILELEEQFNSAKISDFEFKTTPFPHQLQSFAYAKNNDKFLLGDEQGLGKTKQAIDIAVYRKPRFKHCLIVCGVNGLKWNWLEEIHIHSNEEAFILGTKVNRKGNTIIGSVKERLADLKREHDEFFIITNIETVRDKAISKELSAMCNEGIIGMTVIDEIHKCKNPTSQQGKSIHKLNSFYKLALTGTPLMNSPIDLYNILKWLNVENHNFTQFKSYFCVLGGFGGYEVIGYKHLDELQELLDSCMLRRLKSKVLDLPPKLRSIEYVEMSAKQGILYKETMQGVINNIDKIRLSPNPLVELIRLRQVTGYPGILSSTITESVKFTRMLELVDHATSTGGKVIIFSNWTSIIEPAVKLLYKYNPAVITGDTKDRAGEKDRFQNDDKCQVILGTISAMGTGLTLTAGSTVLFLDSPWNRANKEQAEDRAHRIGTKGTVNIITLVCKDTIDERIEELIYKKGEMSDYLVDGNLLSKANRDALLNHLLNL